MSVCLYMYSDAQPKIIFSFSVMSFNYQKIKTVYIDFKKVKLSLYYFLSVYITIKLDKICLFSLEC